MGQSHTIDCTALKILPKLCTLVLLVSIGFMLIPLTAHANWTKKIQDDGDIINWNPNVGYLLCIPGYIYLRNPSLDAEVAYLKNTYKNGNTTRVYELDCYRSLYDFIQNKIKTKTCIGTKKGYFSITINKNYEGNAKCIKGTLPKKSTKGKVSLNK